MTDNDDVKKVLSAHLWVVNLLEKLVELLKKLMTTKLMDFCTNWLTKLGHFAIILGAALGFIFALVYVIKVNDFQTFLIAIGWVLALFVAQYTAHKFLNAGEALVKNNPTRLSSQTFLDCVAFIMVIVGIVVFILKTVVAIRSRDIDEFFIGLAVAVVLEFVALIAFNPKDVNIKIIKSNTAGQDAIGISTFFMKTFMKLVPIAFGAGVIISTVLIFINGIGIFGANHFEAWLNVSESAIRMLLITLLPFFSYIAFAFFYLVVDVIQAILSIPGKLDKKE